MDVSGKLPKLFKKVTFINFNNKKWPSDKDRTIEQFHAVGSTTEEVLKEKFDFNFYNLEFNEMGVAFYCFSRPRP